MNHSFLNALISGLGMAWLYIRYRDKEKRTQVFTEKYKSSYRKAGNPIAIALVILIFVGELVVEFIPGK